MAARKGTVIALNPHERRAIERIAKAYGVDSMACAIRLMVEEKDQALKKLAAKVGKA